jgi:large subunit ribosomal protein L4
MSTLPVYNQEGQEVGTTRLPKEIFGLEINHDLIYQAVNVQLANRRTHLAKTKDRSEVRGGGKKPWRQKGTGRARHGSTRSPLWVGGGVTFGPNIDKVFERKINKKARRRALFVVLSSKVRDKEMIIVDELKIEAKTKKMNDLLSKLVKDNKKHKILIITSKKNENILKAIRNIDYVKSLAADSLNVLDLLSFKYLLLDKESIKVIEKTYTEKTKNQDLNDKK